MTWVRLDDQWFDHPKFFNVGDDGQLAWIKGLTLSSRLLLDGFIPVHFVQTFLRQKRRVASATAELVKAGLWVPVEGGYQIHDFQDYQLLSSQVKAERAASRERMRRWREKPCNAVTNSATNSATNVITNGATNAVRYALRAGARAADGISDPDPEGVQGEGMHESGYDLAWRVWSELWQAKHGTAYQRTIDSGPRGDDRILQRIGSLASAFEDRAESMLRHKLRQYLDDENPWLERNRHPLRSFESDWNKYDSEPTASTQPAPSIVDRPMTDAECDAARKRLDEQNAQRAADREKRAKINAELERALSEMKKP